MSGEKRDEGKLRYDLIPVGPLEKLAYVYTIGAEKYGDNNWRSGIAYSRIVAALMRHLEAWRAGRTVDPDDGQHPLASVAWCALTLMEYENTRPEFDDRPGFMVSLGEAFTLAFKRHMEHEFEAVFGSGTYVPGKPCPECGYTCLRPKDNTGHCCACHQEWYDGSHRSVA